MENLGRVDSEVALVKLVAELEKGLPPTSKLLFRGQTTLYPAMRSGKARPGMQIVPEVENGWRTVVERLLAKRNRTIEFTQAVLQHYGMATHFLDLTNDAAIAGWFATQQYQQDPSFWIGDTMRIQDEVTYQPIMEGIGHVLILVIPNYQKLIDNNALFDISGEDYFIRAKRQDAWLMLDHLPIQPDPNDFLQYILEIDRSKYTSNKSQAYLFPSPKEDQGYMHLLDVPYVQIPAALFREPNGKAKPPLSVLDEELGANAEEIDKYMVFGKRALNIPFYQTGKKDLFNYNPKWKDTVVYEPMPFRLWKRLALDLSSLHRGLSGKLQDAIKISITPAALALMNGHVGKVDLIWPEVQSDNILFVKAETGHDKVILHSPPYLGIWLNNNDGLLIDHQILADEESFQYVEGHGYRFERGILSPVKIDNECTCGIPEEHVVVVKALLTMHELVRKGKLALLQHPMMIKDWYVLI